MIQNIKWTVLGCLLMMFAACTRDIDYDSSSSDLNFRVYAEQFGGGNTRSGSAELNFDRIDIYLFRDGLLDANSVCYYDPVTSSIKAEGLQDGSYEILVLGINGDYTQDGVTVNSLVSPNDTWLTFPAEQDRPLVADYLYAALKFEVRNGLLDIESPKITLRHIVAKVNFDIDYPNQYTEASLKTLSYALEASHYTEFKADNSYAGSGQTTISALSLIEQNEFLFLPVRDERKMSGTITLDSRNHKGEEYSENYTFIVDAEANRQSDVHVSLVNPDDKEGMIYASARTVTDDNSYKILQDDEPKSVYYDKAQRCFFVNQPIQAFIDEEKKMLNVRSYCLVPMDDITIYAKFPATKGNYVRFAYIEYMEDLGNLCYPIPSVGKKLTYKDESGRNITITLTMGDLQNADFQFKVESGNAVYKKYEKMIPKWQIYFSAYGGDPDQENGKPNGNWIGIRPVHIREAIAWFSNWAYLCSLPAYEAAVVDYSGELVGDDANPIVGQNRMTIVNAMRSCTGFQVGLVNGDGTGVGGLGGGTTFGVYQEAYLTHYNSQMHSIKMYHELGHCMGYGHSSSMTYGDWARYIMPYFYFAHLQDAIVTSREVLKSYANSNLYRFH